MNIVILIIIGVFVIAGLAFAVIGPWPTTSSTRQPIAPQNRPGAVYPVQVTGPLQPSTAKPISVPTTQASQPTEQPEEPSARPKAQPSVESQEPSDAEQPAAPPVQSAPPAEQPEEPVEESPPHTESEP